MSKHQGHQAIVFQNPPTFVEDLLHHPFVLGFCSLRRAISGRVGHCFIGLVDQPTCEEIRVEIAQGASLPDVEVVGKLAVLHVIVIRRIHAHQVDGLVWNTGHVSRSTIEDGERKRCATSTAVMERFYQFGNASVGINDLSEPPCGAGIGTGEDHFAKGPFEGKIVACQMSRSAPRGVMPSGLAAVVVQSLINGKLQIGDHSAPSFWPQFSKNFGLQTIQPFDQGKMPQELAWGEQVAPAQHTILDRSRVIRPLGNAR